MPDADALRSSIEQRFPDASCSVDGEGVRAAVTIDGTVYRTRSQRTPTGHVSVELPSTDGFELALSWTDRAVTTPRASAFDDSCLVETNDVALAQMWLDRDAQAALLASRYMSGTPEPTRDTVPMLRDGGWHHELRGDQVIASRTEPEHSAERIGDLLAASLALATRPARWARWFAPLGSALGGETIGRVELGGRPVLRVRRGGTEVNVRLLRRLGPADLGRLRMVVGAHRLGSGGETLTLIADDLPRSAWPPANELGASTLRIDSRARSLLDAARPSTTIVRRHDVEITFDGAFADADRLGAAIQLAAYFAAESAHDGPYR